MSVKFPFLLGGERKAFLGQSHFLKATFFFLFFSSFEVVEEFEALDKVLGKLISCQSCRMILSGFVVLSHGYLPHMWQSKKQLVNNA